MGGLAGDWGDMCLHMSDIFDNAIRSFSANLPQAPTAAALDSCFHSVHIQCKIIMGQFRSFLGPVTHAKISFVLINVSQKALKCQQKENIALQNYPRLATSRKG